MLIIRSEVTVRDITGPEIFDFMANCTDTDYQRWWPDMHLAFHTIKRYPGNLGNLVYFDEYVGKYRLKFKAVITESIPGKKNVWQMKKGIKLPARVILELEDQPGQVRVCHTLAVGFQGIGRILDPLLRLYFSDHFIEVLDEHAQVEFPMLGQLLASRRS